MYCVKCGTELENKEICPSCGQLREDRKEKYVRNTLISGKGLYRSYRGIIIKLLVILYAITLTAPWVMNGQIYQVEIYRGIVKVTSVLYALSVFFALWRILAKAGIHGWAMLIPVYNVYCVFKLAFYEAFQMLLIYISVGFLGTFLTYFGGASGPWILAIFVVFWIVMYIKLLYRISVNFGHGAGYTVGLIFMPYLFILLLGWGNDDYILDRDEYCAEIDPQELRFRPHKEHKKWLFILVALIILGVGGLLYVISLPEFAGTGNADGLSLQVDQSISHIMKINYQNNTPNEISIGWGSQDAKITAITDRGKYSGKIFRRYGTDLKLNPGEKGSLVVMFRDISGNIKQLNFENIWYLGADGRPERVIDYEHRKIYDREAKIQIPVTYNGDTSKDASSGEQNVETPEDQDAEVPKEESKQQYKVATGGTRLNIRKEPRTDAEIVQKLEDNTICESSGNKSEDGSWIEIIIPENNQTGWASTQYLTKLAVAKEN